jgi:hypothetical protein
MSFRPDEIPARERTHKRIAEGRAAEKAYVIEMQERRDRRIAAFLLADVLDLTDSVPVPGALEKRARDEYAGVLDGVRYRVNLRTGGIYDEGQRQPRNPELRALNVPDIVEELR